MRVLHKSSNVCIVFRTLRTPACWETHNKQRGMEGITMTSVEQPNASFWPGEGPIPPLGHTVEVLGLIGTVCVYVCWRERLKPGTVPGTYKVCSTYILKETEKGWTEQSYAFRYYLFESLSGNYHVILPPPLPSFLIVLLGESHKRAFKRATCYAEGEVLSQHAVAQGKLALFTWKMGKIAPTFIPSGVVSGVHIFEVLLGWFGWEFQSVFLNNSWIKPK